MPGPAPKHHSVRSRVNKASTRATLFEPEPDEIEIPELPPMRLVERDLVHGLQKDDRSFATKLALTPPALLVDLAVGWLFKLIGLPFCDCDDDDDDEASGRR